MVNSVKELEASANDFVAIANHVMPCVSNTSLQGKVPGVPVFGRDVNVNIPFVTYIVAVSVNQQMLTDACPLHKNQQCIQHEHAVGDNVFVNNMNEFLFVVLSQFQLKTSCFPQNGLVWVLPALLGRCWSCWNSVPHKCGRVSHAPCWVQELVMCHWFMDKCDIMLGQMERTSTDGVASLVMIFTFHPLLT